MRDIIKTFSFVRLWKKAVVLKFKALLLHSGEGLKRIMRKLLGYLHSRHRFEPCTSKTEATSVNAWLFWNRISTGDLPNINHK